MPAASGTQLARGPSLGRLCDCGDDAFRVDSALPGTLGNVTRRIRNSSSPHGIFQETGRGQDAFQWVLGSWHYPGPQIQGPQKKRCVWRVSLSELRQTCAAQLRQREPVVAQNELRTTATEGLFQEHEAVCHATAR